MIIFTIYLFSLLLYSVRYIYRANTNSMIKDLLDVAINMQRNIAKAKYADTAKSEAESAVLDILENTFKSDNNTSRSELQKRLIAGSLND